MTMSASTSVSQPCSQIGSATEPTAPQSPEIAAASATPLNMRRSSRTRMVAFVAMATVIICLQSIAAASASMANSEHSYEYMHHSTAGADPETASASDLGDTADKNESPTSSASASAGPITEIITVELKSTPLLMVANSVRTDDPVQYHQQLQDEHDQIIEQFRQLYGSSLTVVARTCKLYNAIYLQVPAQPHDADDEKTKNQGGSTRRRKLHEHIQNHDLVTRIVPHATHHVHGIVKGSRAGSTSFNHERARARKLSSSPSLPYQDQDLLQHLNADTNQSYPLTGENVTVGILDTGVDYTHKIFGGSGSFLDYQISVLGRKQDSAFFPNHVLIDGADLVGDEGLLNDTHAMRPDNNPIDFHGHGTAVASAVLSIAPDAKLLIAKTCTNTGKCPDFAVIQGLEFMLERNVDIVNLSLGTKYTSPYFEPVAVAIENAFALGAVVTTSVGNGGNIPYNAGAVGTTPNIVAVAATDAPSPNRTTPMMSYYSSRGPGANNALKPDIAAPSGFLMADTGSGNRFKRFVGTSFASPVVAGVAALLMQRCNGQCSPFFIKCILLNTAQTHVQYGLDDETLACEDPHSQAPLTRMGSGEVSIHNALRATMWAYCKEDVQPSIHLGFMDVTDDAMIVMTRTIVVANLRSQPRTIRLSSNGPIAIDLPANGTDLHKDASIAITFRIDPNTVPTNRMGGSQASVIDGRRMDQHEFGGHIRIASDDDGLDIVIPYHAILRKACKVEFLAGGVISALEAPVSFTNKGLGMAQLEAYEVLVANEDIAEGAYGSREMFSDIRAVGYRLLPAANLVPQPACDYILEFAFHAWEQSQQIGTTSHRARITVDGLTYVLYNPLLPDDRGCLIDTPDSETVTTDLLPDHTSNSAVTILRTCSDQVGLNGTTTQFSVQFDAIPLNREDVMDTTEVVHLDFSQPRIEAASLDIPFGTTVHGYTIGLSSNSSKGAMLVMNSFRDWNNTGAAARDHEVLYAVSQDTLEVMTDHVDISTPDVAFELPAAINLSGPGTDWAIAETRPVGERRDMQDDDDGAIQPEPIIDNCAVESAVVPRIKSIVLHVEMPPKEEEILVENEPASAAAVVVVGMTQGLLLGTMLSLMLICNVL